MMNRHGQTSANAAPQDVAWCPNLIRVSYPIPRAISTLTSDWMTGVNSGVLLRTAAQHSLARPGSIWRQLPQHPHQADCTLSFPSASVQSTHEPPMTLLTYVFFAVPGSFLPAAVGPSHTSTAARGRGPAQVQLLSSPRNVYVGIRPHEDRQTGT